MTDHVDKTRQKLLALASTKMKDVHSAEPVVSPTLLAGCQFVKAPSFNLAARTFLDLAKQINLINCVKRDTDERTLGKTILAKWNL